MAVSSKPPPTEAAPTRMVRNVPYASVCSRGLRELYGADSPGVSGSTAAWVQKLRPSERVGGHRSWLLSESPLGGCSGNACHRPRSAGHGSHRCSLQGRGYLSHRLTLPGYGPPVGGDDRPKGARESGGVPGCGPRPATDQRGASDQPPSPSKPPVPRPYDQCPGLHEPQTKNFVNRPVLHGG